MKRLWKIALCLALALVSLTACSSESSNDGSQIYAEATQYLGPVTATEAPTEAPQETEAPSDSGNSSGGVSIFDNPYLNEEDISTDEALGEENYIDPYDTGADTGSLLSASGASGGVETVYPYAGATPIPLDPVDLPTPTPHPELTFNYATYTAGSLGLSFDCPSGWLVDESQTDVFVLTEPETQMHDGQQCIITISAEPVTANYSEKDLKKQVTQRLKEIGSVNFTVWNPSLTATRTLLGSKGVYAN